MKIEIEKKKKGSKLTADEFNELVNAVNANSDSKWGYIYYDTVSQNYLAFASEEKCNEYLAGGDASLVLGNFEAPRNYEASIQLLTESYNAVLLGESGNVVRFTFDVKNKEGNSTGEGVVCTYTISNGNNTQRVTQRYKNGQDVDFNVDEYLSEGTNTVRITIMATDTMATTTMAVTYQVVNLSLTTTIDISKVYAFDMSDISVEVPFTVSGSGVKTMEWYIDGEKLPFEQNVDEVLNTTVTRTKVIKISRAESEGVHNIMFRAYVKVNGETFYSPTLMRDVMTNGKIFTLDEESVDGWPEYAVMVAQSIDMPVGELCWETPKIAMTQYAPTQLTFAVYDPRNAAEVPIEVKVQGSAVTKINATNGKVFTYDYTPTETGEQTLTIAGVGSNKVQGFRNGGSNMAVVKPTKLDIEEITNSLQLALDARSKTNAQSDKDTWSDNGYAATFDARTKWDDVSGWSNGYFRLYQSSLSVNVAPLSPNPATKGKTLEFEFYTENVTDDDEVLCDMRGSNGAGMLITASEISLTSSSGKRLSTKFRNGDKMRVAIVITKTAGATDKKMAYIYVNGILSGSVACATGETFTSNKELVFSSKSAALLIRSLRFYDAALSADEVLNNYILYRETSSEMLQAYKRNAIYTEGTTEFDIDQIANTLPVMIITGDIPTIEATTDKKKAIVVNVEYINVQDPTRSFKIENAQLTGQGTSSMSYPKKNFRLYTQKRSDTVLYDAEGNVVESRLYSFKEGAIPVNCWCCKADYAESSSTHNTGIARLWNDAMKNAVVDGEYKLRTKAQQTAISNGYEYDVRTTIDGFPIVVFYRTSDEAALVFMGKYNFNNDKSTENVFGFKNIPGFDNSKVECVETLNNGNHLALFQDVENWDKEWSEAFEFRYPDGSENTGNLKSLAAWIASTKGDTTKFEAEIDEHFDLPKLAAYYIYLMRFGAVDQPVKNSMLETEDGQHWFFINYDNDTINGLRNDGPLIYKPDITRQTLDTSYTSEVYAYAGHESVLWNNFEASEKCMTMVRTVDAALYAAGLTAANVLKVFNEEQSAKWCERIYNKDAQYKYIAPFIDNGINNLFMLQGARTSHRSWWITKRFAMWDSRLVTGDYKANSFELKMAGAPVGTEFTIRSGYALYYGYGVNNVVAESGVKLNKGESHTFATKQVLNVGDPLRIYMAPNLTEIDVHNFAPYISTVNMDKVFSANDGTRLTKLTLGGKDAEEVKNTSLNAISGLSSAKYLEELNVNGYKAITALDLSGMKYFRKLEASGSGLQYLSIAEGAPVEHLALPKTIQGLSLVGLNITADNVVGDMPALQEIVIRNCGNIARDYDFMYNLLSKVENPSGAYAEITVDFGQVTAEQLLNFGKVLKGFASYRISGKAVLTTITYDSAASLLELFGGNVFEKSSAFYIDAPTSLYLLGSDVVAAGTKATFKVAAFGAVSEAKLNVSGNIPAGVEVNTETGVVSVERIFGNSAITLFASGKNEKGGTIVSDSVSVTIKGIVDISSGKIDGETKVGKTAQTYTISLNNTGARYSTEWSISGGGSSYVSIDRQSSGECVISRTSVPTNDTSFTLTAKVTSESGKTLTLTKSVAAGGLTDVSAVAIVGASSTRQTERYTLSLTPLFEEIETELTVTWSISGTAASGGNVSLGVQERDMCTVVVNSLPADGDLTYTLSVKVESNAGKKLSASQNNTIKEELLVQPEENGNIQMMVKPVNNVVTLNIADSSGSFVVDWGDGVQDSTTTHTYDEVKVYSVEVSNCANVTGCVVSDKDMLIAYWSVGDSKVSIGGFSGYRYLKNVGKDIFKNNSNVTSFQSTFYYCISLTEIPSGLFDKCPNVTSFKSTFDSCSKLTEIPSGLFDKCPNVTSFQSTFDSCSKLTEIPSGLFDKCPIVTNFYSTFDSCSKLTEIPSGLFDKCPNVTSFQSTFRGCSSLTEIPSGLFDKCPIVTNFYSTFSACSSLTEIPSELFDKCPNVPSFNYTFRGCSSLTEIPNGLFDKCPNVTSFDGTFYECSKLTEIPSGLFDKCPNVTSFYETFNACSKLTEIPSGLFDKCPNVTSFGYTFNSCYYLKKIVFQNAPKCTNWDRYAFNCSRVVAVTVTDGLAPSTYISTALSSIPSTAKIYVNDDKVDMYKAATNWTQYADRIYPMTGYPGDDYYANL